MDERSTQIFEKYKRKISDIVEPRDVIPKLLLRDIISYTDYENIQSLPTKDERAVLLVHTLPKKLDSLSQFVEVLRAERYTSLANQIDLELNGREPATKAPEQLRQTQSAASGIGAPHQRPIGAVGGVQPEPPTTDRCDLPIPAHEPVTSQRRAASASNLEENSVSGVQASGGRAQVDERGIKFLDVVWGMFKQLTSTNPVQDTQARPAGNNVVSATKVHAWGTVAQDTVGEKATLDQFVKKDLIGKPYMHMDMEALSKLTGTETFSSARTDIRSWRYYGNGKDLQKIFKLISHNPQVTEHCWFNITGEVIYEHPLQVPDLPMIKFFYLKLQCQVSSSSATNLELILSELKPVLSNLLGFSFRSDFGRSIPGMRRLLQQIPSSIDLLGFRDILLSEDDISAVVETYENRGKLDQIVLGPTDSTAESFIHLVQKIKHCSTIKYLDFWGLKLTPENEKKFLREVKMWSHLELLWLNDGELHEEGQSELEAVIEALPNLKRVSIWPNDFLVPNKESLKNVCMKNNVRYKEC